MENENHGAYLIRLLLVLKLIGLFSRKFNSLSAPSSSLDIVLRFVGVYFNTIHNERNVLRKASETMAKEEKKMNENKIKGMLLNKT